MLTNQAQSQPVIVTGADYQFARTLWQFLRSAERASIHNKYCWLVYDLGLGLDARDRLTRAFPWISMRNFDYAAYPPHFAMKTRSYAWKPTIVADVLDEFQAPVLWLDSATLITSDLSEVFAILRRNGIFSLKGKPALGEHCDPRVLKELQVSPELLHLPERVGGAIGFDPSHKVARDIAKNWARHALIESHIMPEGAMAKHKAEQALLSALLYSAEAQGLVTLNQDEVDISSGRPMKWFTTRNKVLPWVPRAADPLVRMWYWSYKTLDQFNHRFRDWERRRIGGTERRYREHYEVSVQRAGGAPVVIAAPDGSYYADPFAIEAAGRLYLLVEEFRYSAAKGHLTSILLDENLKPLSSRAILQSDTHSSFPYVFQFGAAVYIVPETHEARSIDLFGMGKDPTKWNQLRRLLYGIDAVDTVLVRQLDYWFLLTSVLEEGARNRHLEIYFAKDLLRDEFRPHPVNAERRYQNEEFGSGRNAGNFIRTAAGLVRPIQNSKRYYGQGVRLMLIKRLDTEGFEEVPFAGHMVFTDVVEAMSPHHVSFSGDVLCWDVRDRAR